jgi:hypothetical protein
VAVLERTNKITYTPEFVAQNAGFDPSYGTWYQYDVNSNFPYTRPDIAALGLAGYTPYPCTIIEGLNNLYSAIAFDSNYSPTTYFMLCGSAVPFPNNTTATISSSYLGFIPPDNSDMLVPTNQVGGSNYIKNIYQSQYEQSLPIGTTALNYGTNIPLYQDVNGLKDYSPYGGFVNTSQFNLRTANYFEGSNHYLLFGDPTGTSTSLCDMYLLRNIGSSNNDQDSIYVKSIDFSNILSLSNTEKIITWTANSYSVFVMTNLSTTTQAVKIYEISTLVSDDTVRASALYHNITNLTPIDYENNSTLQIYPQFSTQKCKLQVNDNKAWAYIDDSIISSSVFNIQRNRNTLIQFNNQPTSPSTFTAFDLDRGFFRYLDVTTSPSSELAYYLYDSSAFNKNYVDIFQFSTSLYLQSSVSGLICNRAKGLSPPNNSNTTFFARINFNASLYPFVTNIFLAGDLIYSLNSLTPNKYNLIKPVTSTEPFYNGIPQSNAEIIASGDSFAIPYNSTIFGYSGDDNGGVWFSFKTGNNYSPKPITVVGNANLGDDIPFGLSTLAYQIFYPTTKIVLTKVNNRFNDINDTTDISYNKNGIIDNSYFEFPRVKMFHYLNFNDMLKDIASTTVTGDIVNWKWGQESNYFRADTEYSGYQTNAYIYNIPLSTSGALTTPSTSRVLIGLNGNVNDYNYILIRGDSPSEDFQIMTRFNLPNRFDYGLVNSFNLSEEISTARSTFNLPNYNPTYVNNLIDFDKQFSTSRLYGENAIDNFSGSNLSSINYTTFYKQFSTIYSQYLSSTTIITKINSTIEGNFNQYLSTYWNDILPSSIYEHSRITDPIPYDLLFPSSINPVLQNKATYWGLGYNLGFDKSNYINRTVYTAPTFYKILEDYIYLKLNDELSMNILDTTGNENLSTVQESTGQVKKYFSKVLLPTFGNYAQTLIGTTVTFNPPLGKLDKLNFSWVDVDGNVIDNDNCEWSCVFLINEQSDVQTFDSVLPRLNLANSNQITQL